jgi:hypothetical protein
MPPWEKNPQVSARPVFTPREKKVNGNGSAKSYRRTSNAQVPLEG